MGTIEPVEVSLDKPRKLLINHFCLYRAEAEVNKLRFAKPEEYCSIDVLMVDAFNHLYRARGMLPLDLLLCMICFGIVYEPKEKRLTLEQIAEVLDASEMSRAELSGIVWGAYFTVAGKNLKQVDAPDEEKKTADPPTGQSSGPLDGSTLN